MDGRISITGLGIQIVRTNPNHVFAAGNSDGDLEMLRYTADNNSLGKSLEILVHHDDGVREYSYDTLSENVLIEAQRRNWTIVSMKDDFRIIYPNTNSTI